METGQGVLGMLSISLSLALALILLWGWMHTQLGRKLESKKEVNDVNGNYVSTRAAGIDPL